MKNEARRGILLLCALILGLVVVFAAFVIGHAQVTEYPQHNITPGASTLVTGPPGAPGPTGPRGPAGINPTLGSYLGPFQVTGNAGNGTDILNTVNVNGVINPLTYTGVDVGAQVNAAIAGLAGKSAIIDIPPKTPGYSFSTTIQCPKTNQGQITLRGGTGHGQDITLISPPSTGTVLNYTGNGDAINDVATVNGATGCVLDNLIIDGNGAGSAAIGFHFGNTAYTQVQHTAIQRFQGGSAAAIEVESASGMWTERWKVGDHTALPLNTTDIAIVCDAGCTSSFGHHDVDVYVNATSGQTVINVGTGASYYSGRTKIQGNLFAGSTEFLVNGLISEEMLDQFAEQSSGPSVMFNVASGASAELHGFILDNGPTNTIGGVTGRNVQGNDLQGTAKFTFTGEVETASNTTNYSYAARYGVFDPTNSAGADIVFGNAAGTLQWILNAGFGGAGAQGNFAIVNQVTGIAPIVATPQATETDLTATGLQSHALGYALTYTNSTKPAAAGNNHYRICVTDAPACTSGSSYASGGGSTNCEVWSNNTNWIESGSGC